ncbi:MAG: Flp family type IVb pilin [Bacilli bacterium]
MQNTIPSKGRSRMNGIKQKLAGIYHSVAVKTGEMVVRLRHEEEGQGLVEYGLIIALVAIVVVVVLTALGAQIGTIFSSITSKL